MATSKGTLQTEIEQTRPFRSRSQEAVLGLFRTSDMLRRYFGRVVEPRGITLQQYNVLRILRGAGKEGLPTLTIAERMVERTPGITRLVDRLESKGWVARRRLENDRRRVLCTITASGLELLRELDEPMDRVDDACLATLGEAELDQLIEILDRIRMNLRP